MTKNLQTQRGFTLIELMIAVAIVAIFSTLLISVSSRTYGNNARSVGDQITATLGMARTRAIATRRIHRVFIKQNELQVWASDTTGLKDDGDPSDDGFVQKLGLDHGVKVWNVTNTPWDGTGSSPAGNENTSLNFELQFKPDGSSNGGTIFLFDTNARRYRVPIYKATGSSYSRANW